jgi:hypothetical protein
MRLSILNGSRAFFGPLLLLYRESFSKKGEVPMFRFLFRTVRHVFQIFFFRIRFVLTLLNEPGILGRISP